MFEVILFNKEVGILNIIILAIIQESGLSIMFDIILGIKAAVKIRQPSEAVPTADSECHPEYS